MSEPLQRLNDDLAAVVDTARRSLVHITNGPRGAGAGVIVDPDGLILTNAHVVFRRQSLKVTLPDGRTLPARLIARDDHNDLALLHVEAGDLPAITFGDSRTLKPGQWVTALGHPWGVPGAATSGVMVGSGSRLPERPAHGREWIAVSLHVRPGHSGGPLVDARGRLIGINAVMAGPDVGLAVPVHVVEAFLHRALKSGAKPAGSPVPV